MNILILLASIRDDRKSDRLGYFISKKLEERNIVHSLIDLQKTPLPLYGKHTGTEKNIGIIKGQMEQSDAMIFISPEYHQTYSAVLKNTVEYFWAEFNEKPIGVATCSAGKLGGIQASNQMQSLILALGGIPYYKKLLIPEISFAISEKFQSTKTEIDESADNFLENFIRFSKIISAGKRLHNNDK